MISFLQANYEFNEITLNKYRADYYEIIEEQPSRKIEKLNVLDSKFESLISKIDSALSNKSSNLEGIASVSTEILNEISETVNNKKDYLLEFEQPKTGSDKLRLIYLKNRLVIAMAYAFEYGSRKTYWADGLYDIKVDSIISEKKENGTKLTLISQYGQTIRENRHILINEIELNGQEKKLDYKLKDNYAFADIEFDSLPNGIYRIDGVLRFYEREGTIDIPFNKEFEVE